MKKLKVRGIKWDGSKLQIKLLRGSVSPKANFFLKEEKSAQTAELNFKIVSHNDFDFVTIVNRNFLDLNKGKWLLQVEDKAPIGKRRMSVGFGESSAWETTKHFKPISKATNAFYIPYLTKNNLFGIHVNSKFELERSALDNINLERDIVNVKTTKNTINFQIGRPIKDSSEEAYVIFKSGKQKIKIPTRVSENGKEFVVNKSELDQLKLEKKWTMRLFVVKGILLEVYTLYDKSVNNIVSKVYNGYSLEMVKNGQFSVMLTKNNSKKRSNVDFEGQLNADNYKLQKNMISFDLSQGLFNPSNSLKFFLLRRKQKEKFYLDYIVNSFKNFNRINIPIKQFLNKDVNSGRWDLFIEIDHGGLKEVRRLGSYNEYFPTNNERFVGKVPIDEGMVLAPYITMDNEFSFYVASEENFLKEKYPAHVSLVGLTMSREGILKVKASLEVPETKNFAIEGITLRLRGNDEKFHFPILKEKIVNNCKKEVTVEINLTQLPFQQFYWDFYLTIMLDGGIKRQVRIANDNYFIRKKLKHNMFKYTINMDDGYMIYPYITVGGGLSLTYRLRGEYETTKDKFKEYLAYAIYCITFWLYLWKPIWLIHEKYSETAQDNSFYFFKYCYENHPKDRIYYVIKKGSKDENNLAPYIDRVVYFMSIKHLLLLLASKVIVSSEAKGHGYAWRVSRGIIRDYVNSKRFVFLQHGVLGLKKVDNTFNFNTANSAELFVVSSDFEKGIVKEYFGYPEKNVIVTGLSRWDVLEDKSITYSSASNKKEIFFMPTWRNWLEEVEDSEFIKSDYFEAYNSLLNSNKLVKVLDENNVRLNFYVHPKFMPYVTNFTSSNEHIKIMQFGDEKVNELIMRSNLLITDYSSVAWEMFYLKKPILFYQFDLKKYMENQGSYMDLEKDLFGEVGYNPTDLIELIQNYIENDFEEKQEFTKLRGEYFNYVDQINSERIYKKIKTKDNEELRRYRVFRGLENSDLVKSLWRKYKRYGIVNRLGARILSTFKSI
ncbi:CDP-glycerol glycerophosphotransferase family protein [Halalkalibacter alkalisediminis]|uniref:CDP-glycerol glycerophosphotransferase family protein n=1 Tax=Halalkalibacter alkalisediminis TaxID=935616 RepID=A0ABV6NEZ0_9BACI|nr:CDP-glycerol glycerophosphotransferase family protein [Halalkalibacter alkalisediminis]